MLKISAISRVRSRIFSTDEIFLIFYEKKVNFLNSFFLLFLRITKKRHHSKNIFLPNHFLCPLLGSVSLVGTDLSTRK